jgi:hypothetical protein
MPRILSYIDSDHANPSILNRRKIPRDPGGSQEMGRLLFTLHQRNQNSDPFMYVTLAACRQPPKRRIPYACFGMRRNWESCGSLGKDRRGTQMHTCMQRHTRIRPGWQCQLPGPVMAPRCWLQAWALARCCPGTERCTAEKRPAKLRTSSEAGCNVVWRPGHHTRCTWGRPCFALSSHWHS